MHRITRQKNSPLEEVQIVFQSKSIVINQTMLSNLWHLAFTIPLPGKRKIKLLESKIEKFVWDNSSIKTNKMVSKLPIQKGGLDIVDIYPRQTRLHPGQLALQTLQPRPQRSLEGHCHLHFR